MILLFEGSSSVVSLQEKTSHSGWAQCFPLNTLSLSETSFYDKTEGVFLSFQECSPQTGRESPATGGAGEGAGGALTAVLQRSPFLLNGPSKGPSDSQAHGVCLFILFIKTP